jgi:hypothetical protein
MVSAATILVMALGLDAFPAEAMMSFVVYPELVTKASFALQAIAVTCAAVWANIAAMALTVRRDFVLHQQILVDWQNAWSALGFMMAVQLAITAYERPANLVSNLVNPVPEIKGVVVSYPTPPQEPSLLIARTAPQSVQRKQFSVLPLVPQTIHVPIISNALAALANRASIVVNHVIIRMSAVE